MKAAITKISLEPSLSACIMKQDEEGVWGVCGGCVAGVWGVCVGVVCRVLCTSNQGLFDHNSCSTVTELKNNSKTI